MKNKENLTIISFFLIGVLFIGAAIYQGVSYFKTEAEVSMMEENTVGVQNYSLNNNKQQTLSVAPQIQERGTGEVVAYKHLSDYIELLYSKKYEEAYKMLEPDYKDIFEISLVEFQHQFSNSESLKDYQIIKTEDFSDRWLFTVRFWENKSKHRDVDFTLFINSSSNEVYFADKGIYEIDTATHTADAEGVRGEVSCYIKTTEGNYFALKLFNFTEKIINVNNIYGNTEIGYVGHEIDNASFLNYQIIPKNWLINNVLFHTRVDVTDIWIDIDGIENFKIMIE